MDTDEKLRVWARTHIHTCVCDIYRYFVHIDNIIICTYIFCKYIKSSIHMASTLQSKPSFQGSEPLSIQNPRDCQWRLELQARDIIEIDSLLQIELVHQTYFREGECQEVRKPQFSIWTFRSVMAVPVFFFLSFRWRKWKQVLTCSKQIALPGVAAPVILADNVWHLQQPEGGTWEPTEHIPVVFKEHQIQGHVQNAWSLQCRYN